MPIQSKQDLKAYLDADRIALKRKGKRPEFKDLIWKFQICMRKREYIKNCKSGIFWNSYEKILSFKYLILSLLCGYDIPLNVFGKGLRIAHRGTIIINGNTQIGDNCTLHAMVNIGTVPGLQNATPTLGDNIYIAPGVKIYGKIHIASGIAIGANAVVNKDFNEENITIAGVPARKISSMGIKDISERNKRQ